MKYLVPVCDKCGFINIGRINTDKYVRSYKYKCADGTWIPMDLCYTCYGNYLKWGFKVKIDANRETYESHSA